MRFSLVILGSTLGAVLAATTSPGASTTLVTTTKTSTTKPTTKTTTTTTTKPSTTPAPSTTKTTTTKATKTTTTTTTSACPTGGFRLQVVGESYTDSYLRSHLHHYDDGSGEGFLDATPQWDRDIGQATGFTLTNGEVIDTNGNILSGYKDSSYAYVWPNRTQIARDGKFVMQCKIDPPSPAINFDHLSCQLPNNTTIWQFGCEVEYTLLIGNDVYCGPTTPRTQLKVVPCPS